MLDKKTASRGASSYCIALFQLFLSQAQMKTLLKPQMRNTKDKASGPKGQTVCDHLCSFRAWKGHHKTQPRLPTSCWCGIMDCNQWWDPAGSHRIYRTWSFREPGKMWPGIPDRHLQSFAPPLFSSQVPTQHCFWLLNRFLGRKPGIKISDPHHCL